MITQKTVAEIKSWNSWYNLKSMYLKQVLVHVTWPNSQNNDVYLTSKIEKHSYPSIWLFSSWDTSKSFLKVDFNT